MKGESDLKDRTKQFALRVIRLFESLPKTTEAKVLGKLLLRSGTFVGANYREAHRGRSQAEFIAKCGDSLRELEEPSRARPTATSSPQGTCGSTDQSAYCLDLLVEGEIVAASKLQPMRAECDELTAIFVTIIKRARDAA